MISSILNYLNNSETPISARTCVLPWDCFLKKANHCYDFDCYTLGYTKPVVVHF